MGLPSNQSGVTAPTAVAAAVLAPAAHHAPSHPSRSSTTSIASFSTKLCVRTGDISLTNARAVQGKRLLRLGSITDDSFVRTRPLPSTEGGRRYATSAFLMSPPRQHHDPSLTSKYPYLRAYRFAHAMQESPRDTGSSLWSPACHIAATTRPHRPSLTACRVDLVSTMGGKNARSIPADAMPPNAARSSHPSFDIMLGSQLYKPPSKAAWVICVYPRVCT